MKKNLLHIFSVGLVAVLFAASTFAQQEDKRMISAASSLYVVSAKAGGVNYTEGKVAVERKQGRSGVLLKGDELAVGDRVSTDANSRAEILLNPGSFVRLAGDSKFEFITVSLDDLQLKLNGGSAMFEIITDNEFTVAVNTPKAKFYIVKSGVYRMDVLADGSGKIEVWKGTAQAGDANATEIKSGRQAVVNGNQAAVAKFDRDEKDALEIWSKARAKELAKINDQFQRTRADRIGLRNSLLSSFHSNLWNMNASYGLWIYDWRFGGYCFLPFGYGWSSPYGYFYRRDIWQYNLPPVVYNPSPTNHPPVVGVPVKSAGDNARPARKRDDVTEIAPPYKRVQRDIGQSPQPVRIAPQPIMIPDQPMPSSAPVYVPMPSKRGGN